MKITKTKLKEIIKEEMFRLIESFAPRFGTKEAVAEAIIGKGMMKDGLNQIMTAAAPIRPGSNIAAKERYDDAQRQVEHYIRTECASNIMQIVENLNKP